MASYKVFLSFALLVACIVATQANVLPKPEEPSFAPPEPQQPQQLQISEPALNADVVKDGQNREKKHAIIYDSFAYTYPAVPLVSSYSYQYHRTLPYAYGAAYYPYVYGAPTWIL